QATAQEATVTVPAPGPCTLAPGAVVQLEGTPHLFTAERDNRLHRSGDTRALAHQRIDWTNRCTVGLEALQAMPRGEPRFSALLLTIGGLTYLAKWEDTEAAPRLLHVQSLADLEFFGLDPRDLPQYTLDRAQWERRFHFDLDALPVGPFPS